MKKPSWKRRRYSITVCRKRTARRLRAILRQRSQDRRAMAAVRRYEWIEAPLAFAIEHATVRRALVHFLKTLRDQVRSSRRPIRIDFRQTKRMSAAGTLLFAAELHRIRTVLPSAKLGCNYPLVSIVAQVLQHVGIFELLAQKRTCRISATTVRYWKVASGQVADGERANAAMDGYRHLFPVNPLYRGLTEAMTNCRQHAYEGDRGDGLSTVPNWWMFSQQLNGRLTVAFCDLGIGIPQSLPLKEPGALAKILAFLSIKNLPDDDARRIQAAMAMGASRTKEDYRGKGLMDIRSVVDELQGLLHIHSNRGLYEYDARAGTERCTNFDPAESIGGTLVLWQIPIPGDVR